MKISELIKLLEARKKQFGNIDVVDDLGYVTPFVGVWIETLDIEHIFSIREVTPFVGVWIETPENQKQIT